MSENPTSIPATHTRNLPSWVIRCLGQNCQEKEACRRYLHREEGGVKIVTLLSLRELGVDNCADRLPLEDPRCAKCGDVLELIRCPECGYLKENVTDEFSAEVEYQVGMGAGAWDQVNPKEIIAAVLQTNQESK